MPKLNRFKKKDEPSALDAVTDENDRHKILMAARAIEMHVMLGCIAIGIVQMPPCSSLGRSMLPRSDI